MESLLMRKSLSIALVAAGALLAIVAAFLLGALAQANYAAANR